MNEPDEVTLCADCPEPEEMATDMAETFAQETLMKGDSIPWQVKAVVTKYKGDFASEAGAQAAGVAAYETVESVGNLITNAGGARVLDQLIGATTSPFNNANSRLGVGNSSTAETVSQTDLQASAGSSNRQFKVMDATFPLRSGQSVTWKSTFSTSEGNFAWNEWCIDRGTANGTTVTAPMLNRKVPTGGLGTKPGTETWVLSVTISCP